MYWLQCKYASETGRPAKFLALHFGNGIWDANVGEVMGHPGTDPEVFGQVLDFAKDIGMDPIPIHMDTIGMQTMYNVDMIWGEKLGDQSLLD